MKEEKNIQRVKAKQWHPIIGVQEAGVLLAQAEAFESCKEPQINKLAADRYAKAAAIYERVAKAVRRKADEMG